MAEKNIIDKLMQDSEQMVMQAIYEKMEELFGAGSQLFAMEFPMRSLNASDYTYNADDCFSTLTKPYPVQEAEFALSEQLFDVSPIVQGSNGEKLSTVYDTALNNFVPKLSALKSFVSDQKNLRDWLLSTVNDEIAGEQRSMSRMALSKELYGEFLEMRNSWYKKRNEEYDQLKSEGDLDSYARWLSTEGLVEEEKLNNAFNDAVVRGHYHEVMTLLGFLNISSPAETLEATKQKMRASLRRSLDGSSDVYPVQFQPSNWFKSLRPNMSPKDLTMATESLLADYKAKNKRLASLKAKLLELGVIEISEEKKEKLAKDIADCNEDLAGAEQALIETHGQGVVKAVKGAISIYKEFNPTMKATEIADDLANNSAKPAEVVGSIPKMTDKDKANILDMVGDISADVVKTIAETYQNLAGVIAKRQRLTDMQMAYADATVNDKRIQKLRIEEQVRAVQADIDFLYPLVSGTIIEGCKEINNEDEPLMVSAETDKAEEDFMDIIIRSEDSASFNASSSAARASQSSWKVSAFFMAAGKQQSSSEAASTDVKQSINKKIEIGFRAKKIAIDRGGWFNPNIFKLSKNYYRLTETLASGGITKDQVRSARDGNELKKLTRYKPKGETKDADYTFPAFTTGFVIAKDITIRIEMTKDEMAASKSFMDKKESSSASCFCFSRGSSSSESRTSESAYFGSSNNFFYIRIPGPQIAGWFLEFTAADNTEPYESLDPEMYAVALQELVQNAVNGAVDEKDLSLSKAE